MASTFRYRGGDCKPQLFPTEASNAYPIEVGDLVYVHPTTGCVRPAANMPSQGTKALGQDAFQQFFAGVAIQKVGLKTGETSFRLADSIGGVVGDPGYCLVATAGRFEFDCVANQWSNGDLVGVYADSAGTLTSQKVDTAASASLAIGQASLGAAAVRQAVRGTKGGPSMTRVTVEIVSSIMNPRGVQNEVSGSGSGL